MLDQHIDEELHKQLTELHQDTNRARERGDDRETIGLRVDTFESHWFNRITDEQRAEINGNKIAIAHAVEAFDHQKRFDVFLRDTWALKSMTPETQVRFWNNRASKSITDERDQARLSKMLTSEIMAATNERFHELRLELSQAIDSIREGREPKLSQQTEHQFYASRREANNAHREELIASFNQTREKYRGNGQER